MKNITLQEIKKGKEGKMDCTEKQMTTMLLRICSCNYKGWHNTIDNAKAYLLSIKKHTYTKGTSDYGNKSRLIVKLIELISHQKSSKMTFSVDIDNYITNKDDETYFPLIVYFNYKGLQLSFHIVPYCSEYVIVKKYIGKRRVDRWKRGNGNNNKQAAKLIKLIQQE